MVTVKPRDLCKAVVTYIWLENLDLRIEDREFFALRGPSGCGKSTTGRLVAGLDASTGGDIFIGGKRVNDTPPRDRDLAMVFQNFALYPHITLGENIGYSLKVARAPRDERERRVGDARVTVKAGPADGRTMDAPVALRLDAAKIHVIDPSTGARWR